MDEGLEFLSSEDGDDVELVSPDGDVSNHKTNETRYLKKEGFRFGICSASYDCQIQKKTKSDLCRVDKGDLVKIFKYNKDHVELSHFNYNCMLVTKKQSHFNLIEPQLYKYLNAIIHNDERFRFYKNTERIKFVLNLKKNTKVSVAVSKNLQIKAVFLGIIEDPKNPKIFLAVRLMEKPTEFIVKKLKANSGIYTFRQLRELKYSFPANMIRKSNFIDVADTKHEKNVIVERNGRQCDVCSTEISTDAEICLNCVAQNDDDGFIIEAEHAAEIEQELTFKTLLYLLITGGVITAEMFSTLKVRLTDWWLARRNSFFNHSAILEYKMDNKYRGIAVIFNHKEFSKEIEADTRNGTEKDVEELCKSLPLLGFHKDHIIVQNNLKQSDILDYWKILLKEKSDILKDSDCLAIFILSHGNKNNQILAFDKSYDLYDLVGKFTSNRFEPMKGKPKLFFIQACRGDQMDDEVQPDGNFSKTKQITFPSYADLLIGYSSFREHRAFRHTATGSWYIQDLCKTISTYSEGSLETTDITELLTYTNYLTGQRNVEFDFKRKKQIPTFNSSLVRKLCFKKSSQLLTDEKYSIQTLCNIILAILVLYNLFIFMTN